MIECVTWEDSESEMRIERTSRLSDPDKFAVRKYGNCLSKDGEWEYEPMPSSRDKAFLDRCRFDCFNHAVDALESKRASE